MIKRKIFQIELEFNEQDYNLEILTNEKVLRVLSDKDICNSPKTKCRGKILTSGIVIEK